MELQTEQHQNLNLVAYGGSTCWVIVFDRPSRPQQPPAQSPQEVPPTKDQQICASVDCCGLDHSFFPPTPTPNHQLKDLTSTSRTTLDLTPILNIAANADVPSLQVQRNEYQVPILMAISTRIARRHAHASEVFHNATPGSSVVFLAQWSLQH